MYPLLTRQFLKVRGFLMLSTTMMRIISYLFFVSNVLSKHPKIRIKDPSNSFTWRLIISNIFIPILSSKFIVTSLPLSTGRIKLTPFDVTISLLLCAFISNTSVRSIGGSIFFTRFLFAHTVWKRSLFLHLKQNFPKAGHLFLFFSCSYYNICI